MEQHYFIGIQVPPEIHAAANACIQQLSLQEHYKVIPHEEEDMHLTLQYIGALDVNQKRSLIEQLTMISNEQSTFELTINSTSSFGHPNHPRVVYLAINPSIVLLHLQQKIFQTVNTINTVTKPNRFTPHITIAKKRKTISHTPMKHINIAEKSFLVSSFHLFSIHPHKYPKYQIEYSFSQLNNPS